MLVRGLSVVLLFIFILQQCVVIRGSTLVREDMPGSEMSGAEFGYNPRSTKGKTLHNEFIIIFKVLNHLRNTFEKTR